MSRLELARSGLEEVECWERASLQCIGECVKSESKRRRLLWEHRTRVCVERLQKAAAASLKVVDDKDDLMQMELEGLCGSTSSNELWSRFYDRVKDIKGYHKKWGHHIAGDAGRIDSSVMTAEVVEEIPSLRKVFTEEEEGGKVLDLNAFHQMFVNWTSFTATRENEYRANALARIKKIRLERDKRKAEKEGRPPIAIEDIVVDEDDPDVRNKLVAPACDYGKYIKTYLTNLGNVPRHCKYRDQIYGEYIVKLGQYLLSYYKRLYPWAANEAMKQQTLTDFEDRWNRQLVSGWSGQPTHQMELYCVHTDRLFQNPEALEAHQKTNRYKKKKQKLSEQDLQKIRERSVEEDKRLAKEEYIVLEMFRILAPYVDATLQNVRKKQARTLREVLDENKRHASDDDDKEEVLEESSDDEDAFSINTSKVKNPLNLPLGWDGKPIPYWLYKLHGLSHTFVCEICGNQKYWGRKVFENHFREWRHAFGMRCLKIPNTVHFKEITKIEDALTLYEKLKQEGEDKAFLPDQEVEVEDAQGNVMTPQTYEDLRKQGLL
ncbi:putative splicing factor 3a subunit [Gregarina niphandrodes]|uniref:Splicing factor 3a subunit n=1 Tax=Gregarina niphandrodes TaxID=110365 RepID=A0A023B3H2_GRENI|nr:putative splicing factor 3a subunit [Gregarina niphandrodes]EZG55332.1 putative splicing factor 3a subunit [Gregarina niphandrodes]|eukprot:XP_011131627.1 putative splicing factor 3a subunit [Gregarina niphandrodes]